MSTFFVLLWLASTVGMVIFIIKSIKAKELDKKKKNRIIWIACLCMGFLSFVLVGLLENSSGENSVKVATEEDSSRMETKKDDSAIDLESNPTSSGVEESQEVLPEEGNSQLIGSSDSNDSVENTDKSEKIYALDAGINNYINHFNQANPEEPITSKMAKPYYHHGRDHMDQIRYIDDNFEIIITGGTKVYIGYTPSNAFTNDEYKEMYKKYLRGFDLGLSDSDMDADWEAIMDDLTHNVGFDSYSAEVYMPMEKINYMTISKKE